MEQSFGTLTRKRIWRLLWKNHWNHGAYAQLQESKLLGCIRGIKYKIRGDTVTGVLGSIWNTVQSIGQRATQEIQCLGKSEKAVTEVNILWVKIREDDLVKQIYPCLCPRLNTKSNLKNKEIEMVKWRTAYKKWWGSGINYYFRESAGIQNIHKFYRLHKKN